MFFLAVAPLAQGRSWHVTVPHKHLTLKQKIYWQRKVIKHDLWVIHTAKHHSMKVVLWHRKQLIWTHKELVKSLTMRSLLLARHYALQQSHILAGVCTSCWDNVHNCEAPNAGWFANTGNSFYGGLQFTETTWISAGGGKYADRADHATRIQQILIASTLPLSNWPNCGRYY